MKSVIALYIFLLISIGTFAQKKNSADTQDKNKKNEVENKSQTDEDKSSKATQDHQDKSEDKSDKQTQDTRYQEGTSGVKRSISYKFSNLNTDDDPGNGTFRYNKDSISGIDYIFVDIIDLSGEDQTKWYSTWDDSTGATGRGRINIVEYEGKNVNVFDIKGVFVEEEGYWKIPVEYVSGLLPSNGATYYYIFERIENKDKTAKEEKVVKESSKKEEIIISQVVLADTVKQDSKVEEAVAEVAAVTSVLSEPEEESQIIRVGEEKKEDVAPVTQTEPLILVDSVKQEVKEKKEEDVTRVTQQEAVVEVKQEPVILLDTVKQEVQEKKEEDVTQVTQQEAIVEVKQEPVILLDTVKQEVKVEEVAVVASVSVVAVASQVEKPKEEPRVRTTQESQPAQSTKPAQTEQQYPVSQPRTTTQSSHPQQKARPAQATQAPSGGNVYSGYSLTKRSDGSRNWHGIIETGYGLKVSDYGINNYRINFISSFSIGQHFMIGLGLGYRRYFDKPDKHPEWYMVSNKSQVPIFLDLRVLFTKKQLTPYLALGLGSSTEKSKTNSTSYGSFVNPSAGLWYRFSKNSALFACVAYEMLEMEYAKHADNIPYKRKNNSISLNIGIQF